jgi:hypothetical protein
MNYSPRPPTHQRRWFRGALALAAVACLVPALWRWGPAAWRRARVLYWQHRALAHTAPADQVVYDDDPADAAKLAKASPDYVALGGSGVPIARWAREWKEFSAASSPPGRLPCAVLFMHERHVGAAGPRLLVVSLYSAGNTAPAELETEVIRPGGPISSPVPAAGDVWMSQRWTDPKNRVRFFAGQLDPTDPSHFSIRFDLGGVRHTLDYWLLENDTLRMQERVADH